MIGEGVVERIGSFALPASRGTRVPFRRWLMMLQCLVDTLLLCGFGLRI